MRRIALINQKGGCGKTTTAINLAYCLAARGKDVLLIDLDPQGHSGLGLGVETGQLANSIYEVLVDELPAKEAIRPVRPHMDAIFSDVVLSAFEQVMSKAQARENRLARALKDIEQDYQYLIVDSPPAVGLLTFNALMACDEVIVPVDPSAFSLQGLGKLMKTIQVIAERANHEVSVRILSTNVDRRTDFCRRVMEALLSKFPEACFKTAIHSCTRVREAAAHGRPVAEYAGRCAPSQDYRNLAREVMGEAPVEAMAPVAEGTRFQAPSFGAEKKGFLFKFAAPLNVKVQIAGDFNNWEPENLLPTQLNGRTVWRKSIPLSPGSYAYKYVIDGRWVPDPENNETESDDFGGVNSIVTV